jgi:hypothetical protein
MERPWEQGIAGCELCVVDGEVNGKPFLVCTEACGTPGESPPVDFAPGNVIERSAMFWLGCAGSEP